LVFEVRLLAGVVPGPILAVASSAVGTAGVVDRAATKLGIATGIESNAIRGIPARLMRVTFAVIGPDGS
jgi:hypothetical protein